MILQASIPRIMRAQAHGKVAKFEFSNTHPIFKPSNRDSRLVFTKLATKLALLIVTCAR